jgi:transcriptional regulator with XRE-family HTH domain
MEGDLAFGKFVQQKRMDLELSQKELSDKVESKKSFGEFIQQKRKELGLTQKELANKLYITESAVSKWERGLSYPDITLIKDLCEVLCISDHELLTASEDVEARTNEKLAAQYMRLIKRFKWTQIILYGTALLSTFICNLAIQHTLSWFFIVLTAIMTAASLTLVPVLANRRRGTITLVSFTVSLLLLLLVCSIFVRGDWFLVTTVAILFGLCVIFVPLVLSSLALPEALDKHKALMSFSIDTILLFALLAVCNWYTAGDWLWSIALPITAFWLIAPWGMLIIIRYVRVNGFFKTAACMGLIAVLYYMGDGFMRFIIKGAPLTFGYAFDFTNWSVYHQGNINMLMFFILIGLTIVFVLAGVIRELHKDKSAKSR